jgi:urease accessory protein
MPRATKILRNGSARTAAAGETLILNFEQRCAKQGFFFTGQGTCVAFDFAEPPCLATDDALLLDDGRVVEIVAEAEPLIEARAADAAALARLAWLLGNRHVPVQVLANRLRLRRSPEIEAMLAGRGARVITIEAPFEPDGGAGNAAHDHHHGHGDHHGRHHGAHEHGHDHAQSHHAHDRDH